MKQCPGCKTDTFPNGTYGDHACPSCGAMVRIATKDRPRLIKQVRTSYAVPFGVEKRRREAVVNGLVMCEACLRPFALDQTFAGTIDCDGETQRIKVEIGQSVVDGKLTPVFADRVIPKTLRGRICLACSFIDGFRLVGRMETPRDEKIFNSVSSDLKAAVRERDPDPTWAHTFDPTWAGGKWGKSDAHRIDVPLPYDDTPPETLEGDIQLLKRQIKRLPLLRRIARRTDHTKWSVERLLRERFYHYGLVISPEPTHGRFYLENVWVPSRDSSEHTAREMVRSWRRNGLLRTWPKRERFIVEPTAKPVSARSLGAPAADRNKCKHGIAPFKVWDKRSKELVYTCTACAPRKLSADHAD